MNHKINYFFKGYHCCSDKHRCTEGEGDCQRYFMKLIIGVHDWSKFDNSDLIKKKFVIKQ